MANHRNPKRKRGTVSLTLRLSLGTLTEAVFGGLTGGGTLSLANELGNPVALSVGNNNQSTLYSGYLAGSGSLVKIGEGTLALSNAISSFAGDIVLREGIVAINDQFSLSSSMLDAQGGALSFGDLWVVNLGGLKGSGNLTLNDVEVQVGFNGQSTTYSGCLSGSLVLHKMGSGTLTLSGENTFTGETISNQGTICLNNANALQNSTFLGRTLTFGSITAATLGGLYSAGEGHGTVILTNAVGAPVALLVGNNNQSTTYAGTLSGLGSLVKIGSGTLTLAGNNIIFTGETVVGEGTLRLGTATQNVVLTGGGANVMGGRLAFDYGGTTDNRGTIRSLLRASYEESRFADGQIYCSLATTDIGLGWIDDAGTSTVTVAMAYYGDANLNGEVDGDDLNVLLSGYGAAGDAVWAAGDFNYDGAVDIDDLNAMLSNYGQSFAAVVAAPEPATWLLLSLAILALLGRAAGRKRRWLKGDALSFRRRRRV